MPVVPFDKRSREAQAQQLLRLPTADEPWVLMAAAAMDSEGRLVAPTKDTASGPAS